MQDSLNFLWDGLRQRRWIFIGATAATLAGGAFGHGDLDERIARLEAALARQPADAGSRLDLAGVRLQHGEWQLALVQLDQVDEIAPGKYMTDFLRGEALLAGDRPAAAEAALNRVLAVNPAHFRALALRARARAARGETEASLADYRAALQAAGQPEPDLIRETADALATQGHPDEAVGVLALGIEKLGAIPSLVLRAIELETGTGRFDAALARIDAMQKAAPRPEPWMARRATVLAQAGRPAEARAAWQALIDHLAALPNLERGSHAMSRLAEQAQQALAAMDKTSPAHVSPTSSS